MKAETVIFSRNTTANDLESDNMNLANLFHFLLISANIANTHYWKLSEKKKNSSKLQQKPNNTLKHIH